MKQELALTRQRKETMISKVEDVTCAKALMRKLQVFEMCKVCIAGGCGVTEML